MERSTVHNHPSDASRKVYGKKLVPGDIIDEDVVLDGPGGWQKCPQELVGQTVQEDAGAVFIHRVMTT